MEIQGLLDRLIGEMGGLLRQVTWSTAVDILLVALIFYSILRLFRGTQAVSLLRGLLVVALVAHPGSLPPHCVQLVDSQLVSR